MPGRGPKLSIEQQEEIRQRAQTQFMSYIAEQMKINVHLVHKVVHNTYALKSQKREVLFGIHNLSEESKEVADRIHQEEEYQN